MKIYYMQELYVSGAENAAHGLISLISPASLLELHVFRLHPSAIQSESF